MRGAVAERASSRVSRRALLRSAALMAGAGAAPAWAQSGAPGFDHRHTAWEALLAQHVVVAPGGNASAVRYAALQAQRPRLKAYLASLSGLPAAAYASAPRAQQLAFLVNAYNAFTLELVLTRYPQLQSIRDLGSLLKSPWKQKFFSLLGQERSLDELEHEMIRAPGVFDEPRIHVALVCASVGCPMLRNEAYVADRLESQLEDAMRRFLSDASRNRYEPGAAGAPGTLYVSRIFDWYRKDFERGAQGIASLHDLFARHADALATTAQGRADLRAGRYRIAHLDYDWSLNDAR